MDQLRPIDEILDEVFMSTTYLFPEDGSCPVTACADAYYSEWMKDKNLVMGRLYETVRLLPASESSAHREQTFHGLYNHLRSGFLKIAVHTEDACNAVVEDLPYIGHMYVYCREHRNMCTYSYNGLY